MKKIFFLCCAIVLFCRTQYVQAFELSPIKNLSTVDPGVTYTFSIKVANTDDNDKFFLFSVFGVRQDQKGSPVFERGINQAEEWLSPEETQVKIPAHEVKTVNFIARIPQNVEPGSYYVGLSAEPVVEKNKNNVNTRLISLLTLQVSGVVRESVVIQHWAKNKESQGKDWKFDLTFNNIGTVEVLLRGLVTIRGITGREVLSQSLLLGNKLLAGAGRHVVSTVLVGDKLVFPGLYKAETKINYGKTGQEVSAVSYVWYFPLWCWLVTILLGLLVIIFFLKRNK